jgi:hypothetical protein
MKTLDLDEGREIFYKSFELQPMQKFFVQTGEKAGKQVMERLEYLASLTIPRSLSWLGIDREIRAMDLETAKFIRDHAIYSNARKVADQGVAHQYGHVLLQGQSAPNSLVGTGSAIALVQETDDGSLKITRKNRLGLDNKQAKELIPEFHNFEERRNDPLIPGQESEPSKMDGEEAFMHQKLKESREETPPLKEEPSPPPLKKHPGGRPRGKSKLPWMRR